MAWRCATPARWRGVVVYYFQPTSTRLTVLRTGEQNAPLIDEILSLKQKQAKLLGFESYADVSLASKMAASVAEIEELHERMTNGR